MIPRREVHVSVVSLLLFGSGACALVYQMVWLREFRLIFGASTAASAAVLAIFMGGLGFGGLLLGPRVDRKPRPLEFYGRLELLIAASAALTPLFVWLARSVYVAAGGSQTLGPSVATIVRLLLAALVLLVPTFLMGGTLPAAARAVTGVADTARRRLALLYGLNTLGAVTGAALATFFLIEHLGNRHTLWAACVVNVVVAVVAIALGKPAATESSGEPGEPQRAAQDDGPDAAASSNAPTRFVLLAAALVGFAFLLMELVWYRMLGPILGGSTFTFGLILAVALAGIGLGGFAYAALRGDRPATLGGFALTCGVEAALIALPFALGDRIALGALSLRSLSSMGFDGMVLGWVLITSLVVLPAAFVSGIQFPMLIALLGRGRAHVGRQVGAAYAWNTAGAIAGSLAGGFGLLPLLTAIGAWRAVVVLLALVSIVAAALAILRAGSGGSPRARASQIFSSPLIVAAIGSALVAVMMLFATGPTAAWRHGGIGAGGANIQQPTPNGLHDFVNARRRTTVWEAEGVESSVAVDKLDGLSFWINGKADGNARADAGTQVMAGLVGAILHPNPTRAMVIGLGTGSTAGWLGAVPEIERVDVVELEPAILHVARMCAEANRDVMSNPKVHITIGDAREAVLTTREQYDIIFSEPSNPYRAGIASLYTREFYEAAAGRLRAGGLFLQWLQAYQVDARTVRTVYATLGSVFPHVETWRTQLGDLVLVGSTEPIAYDVAALRKRVAEEPFRSALLNAWRVTDLEGFVARRIGGPALARDLARAEGVARGDIDAALNTDDRTLIEFAFARSLSAPSTFGTADVARLGMARGDARPTVNGAIDWAEVEDRRLSMFAVDAQVPPVAPDATPELRTRTEAMAAFARGNAAQGLALWRRQSRGPGDFTQAMLLAGPLADAASEDAIPYIDEVRRFQPAEADVQLARLRLRQGRTADAITLLESALVRYRTDPWPYPGVMRNAVSIAHQISLADRNGIPSTRLYAALAEPFSLSLVEEYRRRVLADVAVQVYNLTGAGRDRAVVAVEAAEPHVYWDRGFLTMRQQIYDATRHPLAARAREDRDAFLSAAPVSLEEGLHPVPVAPTTSVAPTTVATTLATTLPTTRPATQSSPQDR